jgi:hypothetical protein
VRQPLTIKTNPGKSARQGREPAGLKPGAKKKGKNGEMNLPQHGAKKDGANSRGNAATVLVT